CDQFATTLCRIADKKAIAVVRSGRLFCWIVFNPSATPLPRDPGSGQPPPLAPQTLAVAGLCPSTHSASLRGVTGSLPTARRSPRERRGEISSPRTKVELPVKKNPMPSHYEDHIRNCTGNVRQCLTCGGRMCDCGWPDP